jgi:uncharacterized protein with HEPN domain
MSAKDKIVIQKIINYIKEAILFTKDLDFDAFMNDAKTMLATAFIIGQIGELVRVLSEETQMANPQIPWINIRGMRNRIIHDYDNVDMKIMWRTVIVNMPELLKQLEELLR